MQTVLAGRGGWKLSDDPGFQFCQEHPQIISSLHEKSVFELDITEKLKILGAMMNQMLTFAGVRDELDNRMESIHETKMELKAANAEENKRLNELDKERIRKKKEEKEKEKEKKLIEEENKDKKDAGGAPNLTTRQQEKAIVAKEKEEQDKQVLKDKKREEFLEREERSRQREDERIKREDDRRKEDEEKKLIEMQQAEKARLFEFESQKLELEKLGQKYKLALKIIKDPRIKRLKLDKF